MPAAIFPDWLEIQAAHVVIGVPPFSTFRTERIIEIPSEIRYSATATTLPHGPRGSVKDVTIEAQFPLTANVMSMKGYLGSTAAARSYSDASHN